MTMLENVNRALAEIGTRSRLSVVDDSTTEGLYASLLYPMLRDSMLRMGDYDWSMSTLAVGPNLVGPEIVWDFAYAYPVNVVRVRTVLPARPDPFDPVPAEWNLYFNGASRLIVTNVPITHIIASRNDCPEATWDSQFTDAFIRFLGSAMTMALENRMEASESVLKNAMAFAGIANMRDD